MTEAMRYFSCTEGASVRRFGTDSYIGASRGPDGMVFDTKAIVAVPVRETTRYAKEYARVLRDGSLVEKKQTDYDAWTKDQQAADARELASRIAAEKLAAEKPAVDVSRDTFKAAAKPAEEVARHSKEQGGRDEFGGRQR